jgi:uncharacterized protein (DUF433 family)
MMDTPQHRRAALVRLVLAARGLGMTVETIALGLDLTPADIRGLLAEGGAADTPQGRP